MNSAIKYFVTDILGCSCPDEVFSSIQLESSPGPVEGIRPGFIIRVGGRLMVIGVPRERILSPGGSFEKLVHGGVGLRDGEGYNRLRIVVVSDDPDSEAMLRPVFDRIQGLDDRVHLHVVERGEIDKMLAGGEAGRGGFKMKELIAKPTVWHEMEGPFIGGREHYQEKSYGFEPLWEAEKEGEAPGVKGEGEEGEPNERKSP